MGIVYEAYDHRLDRKVAVKRLIWGHDDPKARARLRREARTTAQLDHPSIVQVFDLIEDGDDWIVMERLRGTSLAALLESGTLDVETTLSYARQIAAGLAAAHAREIIHRDLKTENVMILADGRVKILDFGIAKSVAWVGDGPHQQDLSRTGAIIGTGRAMSPEQARGERVGPRSDLFSFGILLYECLAGVSPFRGRTPLDTLTRIVTHHPQPLDELVPGIPGGVVDLVARLLSKAPELRPASADDVERSLGRLIAEQGVSASGELGSAVDDQRTLEATGPIPQPTLEETLERTVEGSSWQTRSSSEAAFEVARSPSRSWLLGGAGALALLALVWISTPHLRSADGAATSVESSASAFPSAESSPLRRYEETMASLRRLDSRDVPDQAIQVFREMVERDPESAAAHAGLARATWEKARNASASGDRVFLEQALAMADEAVRLNSYLVDGRASLGLILGSLGRYEEAAEHLSFALELEPTHADSHYGLGQLAESEGRFDEAEERFRRAGELQPAPLYFNALGALLYDRGRYEAAAEAFEETLAVAPNDLNALRNLGAVYHAEGRLEDAAEKLQVALTIRADASLFSNLGTVLFSRGLYSQASAAFEDALAMEGASNRFIFWLNLADADRQLPGRAAEAERSYRRAIQLLDRLVEARPTDVRLRSRRGLALARLGAFDRAREDLELVRREGTGSDLYSLFRRVITEELLGEREQALAALGEALHSGFSLAEVRYEPDLVDLRADPRFHHLLVDIEGDP